jgi:aldehyde:ferredoxin oxidoreductase
MKKLELEKEEVKEEYRVLGGRALSSEIINNEVSPTCNPLGNKNKIVIAPGLLAGTKASSSGRISVGGKSPLTGTIKEANAGGTISQKLAKLGIKSIIIEDIPEKNTLYTIKINSDSIEIVETEELKGKGTYETTKILHNKFGDKYSVMCIGPAGEERLQIASIAITNIEGDTSRHAARGGLGAVLGSKQIKAIIVDNDNKNEVNYENGEEFTKLSKNFAKKLIETKSILTKYGTSNLVDTINGLKGIPTQNFKKGQFEDHEKINGDTLRNNVLQRNGKMSHACHPGCVIRCSNIYNDKNGNYLTSGFEYETIALVGSNCGINDLDLIAQVDRMCDDFGIDTMDFGVALGILMESGVIKFGDKEAVRDIIKNMWKLTPLARILGSGAGVTGKVFGVRRVPTVKNQALSAYDPRVFQGTGVTYATSTMGSDHTAGNALPGRTGYRTSTENSSDFIHYKGEDRQVDLSQDLQVMVSVCDALGFCFFVGPTVENMELFSKLINAKQGTNLDKNDLLKIGEKIIKTEREFNRKAGFDETDDILPEFFVEEGIGKEDLKFEVSQQKINNIFKFDR